MIISRKVKSFQCPCEKTTFLKSVRAKIPRKDEKKNSDNLKLYTLILGILARSISFPEASVEAILSPNFFFFGVFSSMSRNVS